LTRISSKSLRPVPKPSYFNSRCLSTSSPKFSPNLVEGFSVPESAKPPRPAPERDSSHPSLFYHLISSPSSPMSPIYALSFLDKPLNEHVPKSRVILGWVGGQDEEGDADASSVGFQENAGFRDLLHESIASALLEPGFDPAIENEATQRGEGWLNINDTRNIPALNRVGDPDDIIGTVMVQDGKIVPSTYQPMPTYRVCTHDGLTMLTDGLAEHLKAALEKEWDMERKQKA